MREFDSPRTHQGLFALEAHQDEHPAFNRRAVGSIPIGRTRFSSPRRLVVGRQAFNLRTRVQFSPRIPCVPLVQWITTRVYETRNSGSSPERDTKIWARLPAARMGHCLCLDGGSIPHAPAKVLTMWTRGLSRLPLKQDIRGFESRHRRQVRLRNLTPEHLTNSRRRRYGCVAEMD